MKIYCDLDNVLLEYQGSEGFDKMPWKADGQELWDYLKPINPIILSSAKLERLGVSTREKVEWCAVNLGEDVPLIVVPQFGKWPYARAGLILIDDDESMSSLWTMFGGVFVHHATAEATIEAMKELIQE